MKTQPLPETLPDHCFYAPEGWEEIFSEAEEAVERYVEGFDQPIPVHMRDLIERAPWPLVLVEFVTMPKPKPERMLERLLEEWHEDYGDPGGDPAEPTPAMLAAMQTIIDGLEVWGCQETGRAFTVSKEQAKAMILEGGE